MAPARFLVALAWAACLLSPQLAAAADAADIDCPGPDEAFVSTCSGPSAEQTPTPSSDAATAGSDAATDDAETNPDEADILDESDLVNEVLEDAKEDPPPQPTQTRQPPNSNEFGQEPHFSDEPGYCDANEGTAAIHQLQHTTKRLLAKYYDPLPHKGKTAIGILGGFAASRLSLGAANRVFRILGATWVLSEAMHTSGFCDELQCIPGEARPWVGILRRAIVTQCMKVRALARKVWDQERIRKFAQRDEMVAAGFAAGAFIGFVV